MKNTNNKECEEKLAENKVLSHHTKNLLKETELEEEDLMDEVCKNLDE